MMAIIKEKDLLSISQLKMVKVNNIHFSDSYVELEADAENFLECCLSLGINTVFYKYKYYNILDFTVTDELLNEHTDSKQEFSFCQKWANQYNSITDKLDYENPYSLCLFASAGAITMVCIIDNEWMEYEKAEDALCSFQEEHEEELLEFFEYKEGPTLVDELRDTLLEDKEFRYCTNKMDRARYLDRFMGKKDNKRFWLLAKGARTEWERTQNLNIIVNRIYNEYRNECYVRKIQVGEKL